MLLSILKIITELYIVIFSLLIIIGSVCKIRISKVYYYLVVLLCLCVSFWAYQFNPFKTLDLYRMYNAIDVMRNYSTNIVDAIKGTGSRYQALFGTNLLFYIVSRTGNDKWLQTIGTLTTSLIITIIIINYSRTEKYNSNVILPSLVLCFMGMPMQYVLSGVRNSMAVALTLLFAYLVYYKKTKHRIMAILIYVLGITIHPVVLLIIPIIIASKFNQQKVFRVIALLGLPLIFLFAGILKSVPISFIQYICGRVLYYKSIQYQYDRPEMIANIWVFIVTNSVYRFLLKRGQFKNVSCMEIRYANTYYLLGCLMIGCAVHRDFTLRIGYMMGIMAIPIFLRVMYMHNAGKNSSQTLILKYGLFFTVLVCSAKVFYDTYYIFSQYTFN